MTFLLVSLLMAYANFKIRKETGSSTILTILSIFGLSLGAIFIAYYELTTQPQQLVFILGLYILLTFGSWLYSRMNKSNDATTSREPLINVIPAKAGIHKSLKTMDSRFRGSDE